MLAIVGPCSIHDPDAALDYAQRLARVRTAVADRFEVVMRVYFEKPRTTVGWKGLINDPFLDGSCDLPAGLELARRILLDINGMGIPCAGEMLDPIVPQYIADLLSWVAIGARTTESQTHREMASGLSMPVGF
jgi:3-deoxy-7-phosphoheptulonate synthase